MSFSVNVRLGEVSATTSLSELSASVTISGGLLRSIPFSANKDTELEFADTITFSVDNPDSSIFYYWEVENENGYKRALGQSVKQDYAAEGSYDVNLIASNTNSIEGVNFEEDFVKVDFQVSDQLLDDVPGAAAAYSIRLLRSGYSGGLLRVRAVDSNGTDQGEADVQDDPATKGREITLNSPIEKLDSNAKDRGLSNSDTLGDLVDSGGANYDGFVPKWYDQSLNAYHANNRTASEQPQVVDAGGLIKKNNRVGIDFLTNVTIGLTFGTWSNTIGTSGEFSALATINVDQYTNSNRYFFGNYDRSDGFLVAENSGDLGVWRGDKYIVKVPLPSVDSWEHIAALQNSNKNSELILNNSISDTSLNGKDYSKSGDEIQIGNSGNSHRNNGFDGLFQTVVFYPNRLSSSELTTAYNAMK